MLNTVPASALDSNDVAPVRDGDLPDDEQA
jgi:hypothetical protein